ncbi:MAG: 30S ribosomal protein S6e [Methanosarcinaceae archaeon]|nr:30S ribosomal protein S6e [Methanosarcinaceae archaeon]
MANFKIVVSDPKTKTYQIDVTGPEANQYIGKSIGQTVDGATVGLNGYALKITGGSDKIGTVMRGDLPGSKRTKVLVTAGIGAKPKAAGSRRRMSMRGRVISPDTSQINTKIVEYGEKPIGVLLGGEAEGEVVEEVTAEAEVVEETAPEEEVVAEV